MFCEYYRACARGLFVTLNANALSGRQPMGRAACQQHLLPTHSDDIDGTRTIDRWKRQRDVCVCVCMRASRRESGVPSRCERQKQTVISSGLYYNPYSDGIYHPYPHPQLPIESRVYTHDTYRTSTLQTSLHTHTLESSHTAVRESVSLSLTQNTHTHARVRACMG